MMLMVNIVTATPVNTVWTFVMTVVTCAICACAGIVVAAATPVAAITRPALRRTFTFHLFSVVFTFALSWLSQRNNSVSHHTARGRLFAKREQPIGDSRPLHALRAHA
jgi:uncharacterized protein (DUF58 family)